MYYDPKKPIEIKPKLESQILFICPYCYKDIPEVSLWGPYPDIYCKIKCSCSIELKAIELEVLIDALSYETPPSTNESQTNQDPGTKYCIECSSWKSIKDHNTNHTLINYELQLKCNIHHQNYIAECQSCHLNLCPECKSTHPSEHTISTLLSIDSKIIEPYRNQPNLIISKINYKYEEMIQNIEYNKTGNMSLICLKRNIEVAYKRTSDNNILLRNFIEFIYTTLSSLHHYPCYQLCNLIKAIQFNYTEPETDNDLLEAAINLHKFLLYNNIIRLNNMYQYSESFSHKEMLSANIIAINNNRIASFSSNYSIEIWNTKPVELKGSLKGHNKEIISMLLLTNDKLASWSKDSNIRIWDCDKFDCVTVINTPDKCCELIELKEHNKLAACLVNKTLMVFDSLSYKCLWTIPSNDPSHLLSHRSIFASSDGRIFFGSKSNLHVLDCNTGETKLIYEGKMYHLIILQLLDDDLFVSCSQDPIIKLWDMKTYKCLADLTGHLRTIHVILNLSDGEFASGGSDRTIRLWDKKTYKCIVILKGHTEQITKLIMLKSGLMASGSFDGFIKIWDIKLRKCITAICDYSMGINALIEMDDEGLICGNKSCICIFDKVITD